MTTGKCTVKMSNHVAIKNGLSLQLYYSPLIEDQILKMLLILGEKKVLDYDYGRDLKL